MLPSSFLSGGGPAFLGLPAKNKNKIHLIRTIPISDWFHFSVPETKHFLTDTIQRTPLLQPFSKVYVSIGVLKYSNKNTLASMGPLQHKERKKKQYIEQENWKLTKHGTNHQAARLGPLWLVGASETQMFIKFKEEKQIPKIRKSLGCKD